MASMKRSRLVVRSAGHPSVATIELDGEQMTFVSRLELVLDARGNCGARLTVPAELLDIDADVEAFVVAHAEARTDNEATATLSDEREMHPGVG